MSRLVIVAVAVVVLLELLPHTVACMPCSILIVAYGAALAHGLSCGPPQPAYLVLFNSAVQHREHKNLVDALAAFEAAGAAAAACATQGDSLTKIDPAFVAAVQARACVETHAILDRLETIGANAPHRVQHKLRELPACVVLAERAGDEFAVASAATLLSDAMAAQGGGDEPSLEQALHVLDKGLRLCPRHAGLWLTSGTLLLRMNRSTCCC